MVGLREARALLNLGLWDGAYYLAGYAIEYAVKACIAKATRRYEFPDKKKVDSSHSHDLSQLIKVAGLEGALLDKLRNDTEFRTNWLTAQYWSEQTRYRRHAPESAKELVAAVTDRNHGVLPWIRLHW